MEKKTARKMLSCLLYTSDAADERSSVDLGGRRIIKKKTHKYNGVWMTNYAQDVEGTVCADALSENSREKDE